MCVCIVHTQYMKWINETNDFSKRKQEKHKQKENSSNVNKKHAKEIALRNTRQIIVIKLSAIHLLFIERKQGNESCAIGRRVSLRVYDWGGVVVKKSAFTQFQGYQRIQTIMTWKLQNKTPAEKNVYFLVQKPRKRKEKKKRHKERRERATKWRRELAHDVKETGNYQNVCTEVD